MSTAEIVNAVINGLVALGTLSLAVLTVYGDPIRAWFTGPKLRLQLQSARGSMLLVTTGEKRIYHHLKVVNTRPSALATNCRVQLKRLSRRLPNGEFADFALPYPMTMMWPPSEFTPESITFRRDHQVDFGYLQPDVGFIPNVRVVPYGYDIVLRAGHTMRYGFEIVSDNFVSSNIQTFEVSWDGTWNENLDEMAKHLVLRPLDQPV